MSQRSSIAFQNTILKPQLPQFESRHQYIFYLDMDIIVGKMNN